MLFPMSESKDRLLQNIRAAIIGQNEVLEGPYGPRRLTYADYTASGRALSFIEDYLRDEVMPLYANTHSESSGTGLQTTRFREDARQIIRDAVGADERDAVIFCGSGATSAINKLIDVMNLRLPRDLDERYALSERIPADERPVVFIGPYEHHSNELPWRESLADVVVIQECEDGQVDLEQLEAQLIKYADRAMKIGSFSAASNVTGIITNTRAVSALLHQHGALSFWDFAAAAPYVKIEANMNDDEPDGHLIYKDAIFISPHKFIGGPGTPGILIAKKSLFTNSIPVNPGGGTVSYVSPTKHRYIDEPEHREEAGTPAIIESIRAGLVFQLKEAVTPELIEEVEDEFVLRAIKAWDGNPNMLILGNHDSRRLSIVSFVVRYRGGYLHHSFVAALLNDLLGIQARAGCSCAGPYGHRLLGIDKVTAESFDDQVAKGCVGVRPGWVRLNFNYFLNEETFEFILRAVELIANHGWRLLPDYAFCSASGNWVHRGGRPKPAMRLADISYASGELRYPSNHTEADEQSLEDCLAQAERILLAGAAPEHLEPGVNGVYGPGFESLRWFPLPHEVAAQLRGESNEGSRISHPLRLRCAEQQPSM
jgi:selenocysteine lyase/cysteine desulfurase